jgi:hypothetical protein
MLAPCHVTSTPFSAGRSLVGNDGHRLCPKQSTPLLSTDFIFAHPCSTVRSLRDQPLRRDRRKNAVSAFNESQAPNHKLWPSHHKDPLDTMSPPCLTELYTLPTPRPTKNFGCGTPRLQGVPLRLSCFARQQLLRAYLLLTVVFEALIVRGERP